MADTADPDVPKVVSPNCTAPLRGYVILGRYGYERQLVFPRILMK